MTKIIQGEVKSRSVTTRKRTRTDDIEESTSPALRMRTSRSMAALSPSIFSEPLPDIMPTPPLRRRVNPASLANRLGPELVAELESLIKPGCTEMPSFSARQAIQKKYMVDRRHIYDWYHTKGLRVSSKSERRAQMLQAEQEEARALRSRFQKNTHLEQPQLDVGSSYSASTSSTPISTPMTPHTPMTMHSVLPHYSMNVNMDFGHPYPASFPIHHLMDPHQGMFTPNMQPQGAQCVAPETIELRGPDIRHEHNQSPLVDRTSRWVANNQNSHVRSNSNDLFPFLQHEHYFNENMNPFLPAVVAHSQALPKPEREACYRYLSEAVGPAQGVQESVGTYRAYMTQQVQTYYDRLVPGQSAPGPQVITKIPTSLPPPPIAIHSHSLPSVPHTPLVPQDVSRHIPAQTQRRSSSDSTQSSQDLPNTPNFEWTHWLLHNQMQPPNPTPSSMSDMSTPTMSASMSSTTSTSLSWPWSASQSFGTEEKSSLEISDILESPVLRTRNNTRVHPSSPAGPDINQFAQFSKSGEKLPTPPPIRSSDVDLGISAGASDQDTLVYPEDKPLGHTIHHPASFSMSLHAAKFNKTENPASPQILNTSPASA